MSETSVKVVLELADKAAQKALGDFISKSDTADKSLKKLGDSGKGTFNEIAVSIGKSAGVFEIFQGNLLANLATKAFDTMLASASALFDTFIVDGVKAAEEQEKANNQLNIALAQTGIYSEATAKEFQVLASEIQAATGVTDEAIIANAALIQSLGQLDKEGLKKATQAAVDLSAALGRDLASTSEALGKAAAGNTTAIQKMGIQFDKGASDAQTFDNILASLERRFGGTAAAQVNTFAGSIGLVKAAFGEFQEEIGNTIVKNNVVIEVIKTVGSVLSEMTITLGDNKKGFQDMVANGILIAIDGLLGFAAVSDQVGRIITSMVRSVISGFDVMTAGIVKALEFVGAVSEETANGFTDSFLESASKLRNTFTEDTGLGKITEILARLKVGAEKGFAALQAGADTSVSPLNNAAGAVKALSDEQVKANKELENFVVKLAETSESAKGQFESRLSELQSQRDLELIGDQEFYAQKQLLNEEYFAAEMARIQQYRTLSTANQNTANAAELALTRQKQATLQKEEKVLHDQRIKGEQAFSQARVNIISASANLIAALTGSSSKEAFYAMKAAALAQAIVATNLAAAQALAVPPAPNVGLAALAKTAGYINIAAIAATAIQGPAFQEGGIVPGNSFSGDKVSARVNSGEMVLNRGQQTELYNIAKGSGAQGSDSISRGEFYAAIEAIVSRPTQIIIDGKEIINVTRAQLASGRSFA